MPTHDVQPQPGLASRTRAACAFTLVEMVVAIGAVALLTIGIGQIFDSVGSLVSTGSALAQTDQAARAIEDQLREDFASFNAMRADETFLMIRNRRIRRVYLSPEQRDEDRRAGIAPSSDDSLAISSRLDEIMFLGIGSGNNGLFSSAQFSAEPRRDREPSAQIARIYYGHGLRPSPEIGFDPDETLTTGNTPGRKWIPDGDFGQRRGLPNRFDSGADTLVAGRNQFAGDWLLLRQALLLMGSDIAVQPLSGQRAPLDPIMTYAPYIRATEAETRSSTIWPEIDSQDAQDWPGLKGSNFRDSLKPRFLPFGRTDMCAQSPEEVQRWIEGVYDDGDPTTPLIDATPFDSRPFDVQSPAIIGSLTFPNNTLDSALWTRFTVGPNPNPTTIFNTNKVNLRGYQSALAGMFTRLQAESDPPFIDRQDSLGFGSDDPVEVQGDDPSSAFMDLHATLGTRCSRFEIAWSDGTTWPISEPDHQYDSDGDGIDDVFLRPGDLVWFDIDFPRLDPDTSDDLDDVIKTVVIPPAEPIQNPEITWRERENRLWTKTTNPGPYVIANFGNTDAMFTGAVVDADRENKEYLALWGYRRLDPSGTGEYLNEPWITPESIRLIRIRMTIHDNQLRLNGGRTYEFVFPINPRQ